MLKIKAYKASHFYYIVGILLLSVTVYQLKHITGPMMYPDEIGYWANAAYLAGYDWSDIASLQSYYSFGYSILLLPLLKWITSPALTYSIAIIMNAVMVYFHAMLILKIAENLTADKKSINIFLCIPAVFYPGLLFSIQLTWTECLLTLLFAGSVWLLLNYNRSRKIQYGVLFAGILIYMYFVHMRALGILLAGAITVICMREQDGRKEWKRIILLALFIIICLAAGSFLKEYLQNGLYVKADQALLDTNDYGGQIPKVKALFTAEGIFDFAVSCIGKMFYIGIATGGTIYFGVWHVIKQIRKNPVYIYLLMTISFTFGITALYTMSANRADTYIYGRYNEFIVPVFIYLGLYEMLENKNIWRITAGIIVLHGGIAFMLVQVMAQAKPRRFQGYFTVGISYILQEYMPRVQDYIFSPLIAGTVVMLLLVLVMGYLARRKKKMILYLALLSALFIYTAVSAGEKYIYDHSIDTGMDMDLAGWVKKTMKDDDKVIFINSENDSQYVDILQFCLKEYPLRVVEENEFVINGKEKPDYVFTYQNNRQEMLLNIFYDTAVETYHFKLYYNKADIG